MEPEKMNRILDESLQYILGIKNVIQQLDIQPTERNLRILTGVMNTLNEMQSGLAEVNKVVLETLDKKQSDGETVQDAEPELTPVKAAGSKGGRQK